MSLFDLIKYPIGPDKITNEQLVALPAKVGIIAADKISNCLEYRLVLAYISSAEYNQEDMNAALIALNKKQIEIYRQLLLEL